MKQDSRLMDLSDGIRSTDAVNDITDADKELSRLLLKQERYKADTKHRLYLAWSIMGIIIVWLLAVIVILCFNTRFFHLSDIVLVTLLGTTTVTVIGLPAIVLKGFFQFMNQNTDIDRHSK